jgi:glycerol-3-phosphate acyltransferase PlsX
MSSASPRTDPPASGAAATGGTGGPAGDIVISIDAMGGDRGVADVIHGMGKSLEKNPRLRYILHGDSAVLGAAIRAGSPLAARTEVRHAPEVVAMDDKPSKVLRNARGTSMWSALEAVKAGESPVVISCGNTGALMALAMLALRKAPGVNRPAIAVLWPSLNPTGYNVLLDAGADIRADGDDLVKFAVMGASYARNALGLTRPRVGLLNVGTEEHKGRSDLHEAAERMAEVSASSDFDYIGYVEGTDMPSNRVDVIVTDGFTGNVALKTGEGTARMIQGLLREAFAYSILSKIGALFALTSLQRLRRRIDPRRANGGVFLGLNGAVVKSHGGADGIGHASAIELAARMARDDFPALLARQLAKLNAEGLSDGRTAENGMITNERGES